MQLCSTSRAASLQQQCHRRCRPLWKEAITPWTAHRAVPRHISLIVPRHQEVRTATTAAAATTAVASAMPAGQAAFPALQAAITPLLPFAMALSAACCFILVGLVGSKDVTTACLQYPSPIPRISSGTYNHRSHTHNFAQQLLRCIHIRYLKPKHGGTCARYVLGIYIGLLALQMLVARMGHHHITLSSFHKLMHHAGSALKQIRILTIPSCCHRCSLPQELPSHATEPNAQMYKSY